MVQFANDIGTDVFVRGIDAGERARRNREQVSIDTAIRAGLAQQQQPGGAVPALAPTPMPTQAPAPPPTQAPTPPPAAQPPSGGATPAATPAPAPAAPAGPISAASSPPRPQAVTTPALAPSMSDRYDPVIQNLARTPGGGVAALGVMREQDRIGVLDGRRRDMLTRQAMTAYARGDRLTGDWFAGQSGVQLPPGFGAGMGRGGRGAGGRGGRGGKDPIAQAALWAQDWYGTDPARGQAFMQTFLRTGGDLAAAIEAGGPFTGRASNVRPHWVDAGDGRQQFYMVGPGGQAKPVTDASGEPVYRVSPGAAPRVMPTADGLQTVDPRAGTARPVTGQDGQPVMPPARAAGGGGATGAGRQYAIDRKYAYLVQSGLSETEAARIAGGGAMTANGRAQLLIRIQKDVAQDLLNFDTPAKQSAEVQRRMAEIDQMFGGAPQMAPAPRPGNLPQAQADAPALAPAPAPAAPSGAPAPAANIPAAAIDYLRKNPSMAGAFDQKYGQGAAARVLGGK